VRFSLFAAAFFAFSFFSPGSASAQLDITGYAGIGLGTSNHTSWCDIDLGNCDDSGFSWKLFGGANLTSWLGAEAGYVSFGELSDSRSADFVGHDTYTIDSDGWYAAAIGRWPISESFSLYGKFGFHRTSAEWESSDGPDLGCNNCPEPVSVDISETDLLYGIGAEYVFKTEGHAVDGLGLRLEWERFAWGGDIQVGEQTLRDVDDFAVDLFSISVIYQF